MKQHIVAKLSSLALAFALLVGTTALTTPAAHAASSSTTVRAAKPAPHTIVPHTIVNVGGGTWNYGTENCGVNCKHVWSHYVHNSLYHSATTICAAQNRKVFANATFWANSDINCGWLDSAAEYWATY